MHTVLFAIAYVYFYFTFYFFGKAKFGCTAKSDVI